MALLRALLDRNEFLSGLFVLVIGGICLAAVGDLEIGTAQEMGPGYVPRMLSLVLVGLGILICIVALVSDSDPVEKPKWKPITLVTIGIVCFALLFERAGLIPALIVLILIASLANEEFKLIEVIGNMVALSVLCTLVFKLGLGMNISILRGVW